MNKTTYELVEEISSKEGVNYVFVEPYKKHTVTVEGPCIILIVED